MDKEKLKEEVSECSSVEKLLEKAKEKNITLSEEKAKEIFREFHFPNELNDEELENVSGGGCGEGPTTIYPNTECFTGHYKSHFEVTFVDGKLTYVPQNKTFLEERMKWFEEVGRQIGPHVCGTCYWLSFSTSGVGKCSRE